MATRMSPLGKGSKTAPVEMSMEPSIPPDLVHEGDSLSKNRAEPVVGSPAGTWVCDVRRPGKGATVYGDRPRLGAYRSCLATRIVAVEARPVRTDGRLERDVNPSLPAASGAREVVRRTQGETPLPPNDRRDERFHGRSAGRSAKSGSRSDKIAFRAQSCRLFRFSPIAAPLATLYRIGMTDSNLLCVASIARYRNWFAQCHHGPALPGSLIPGCTGVAVALSLWADRTNTVYFAMNGTSPEFAPRVHSRTA